MLQGAALALTNNSGGMHLADAVRTPLVVTFAGTEPEGEYAPRDTTAVLLRVPTRCSPCRTFDCPYAQECLDLSPDQVAAAAFRLLEERAA
jgi:ADP-heptose:LPS heptosyltransferase